MEQQEQQSVQPADVGTPPSAAATFGGAAHGSDDAQQDEQPLSEKDFSIHCTEQFSPLSSFVFCGGVTSMFVNCERQQVEQQVKYQQQGWEGLQWV